MKEKTKRLNKFLKTSEIPHPIFIFITGASGTGKTTVLEALETLLDPKHVSINYFDNIGVPSFEEMMKGSGSLEKWQEAATHQWVENLATIQGKKLVFLEGQFNPQFVVEACQKFHIEHYLLLCLYADRELRTHRLHHRDQPELVNEDMNIWAEFLKTKTLELGGVILDSSGPDAPMNANDIITILMKEIMTLKDELL